MTSTPTPSIIDTRRDQMFPTLEALEVERVRRFGKMRAFTPTEPLAQIGKVSAGLSIILSGEVDVTRQGSSGQYAPIVTYGPGAFLGELAQLAGRPALVNATARGPVEALIIPPDQLRSLLVAEAELGERIMRALILRRIGLMETGRRPCRQRRRTAAPRLSPQQRPSACKVGSRSRSRSQGTD